jgi:hypothetical protein
VSDPTNPWACPVPGAPSGPPGPTGPGGPGGPVVPDPRFGSPPQHPGFAPVPAPDPYSAPAAGQYPTTAYPQAAYPQAVYPQAAYPQTPYPQPAYGYGPAPHTFRGNQGLGTALLVLGGVLVAGLVLRAATATSAVHAYDAAWARGVDPTTVSTAHDVLGVVFAVIVPMWIVGALWISRAHANATALAPAHLRRSRVWCWLAWIVPVVSWWFPKQLVDDTWRITAHQLPPTSRGRYRGTGWWWGLWVAFSVLLGSDDRQGVFFTAGSVPDRHLGVHPGLDLVVAVLGLAAYALWVPVVLGLSRAQEELAQRFTATPWR